jgi:hypothetical protein
VAEILACINKSKVTFSGGKPQKIGSLYHNFTTQSMEEGMSNHLGHHLDESTKVKKQLTRIIMELRLMAQEHSKESAI